ncbi:hypothetical protein CRUP_010914 [Coryphaenoides rupestris]|nr:hypothetical protein CRUP_010914 [Coryphaenoides rupestris]
MDASQYPGYPSNYWYPQSHSTPHYANAYPSGTEMQPAYNPQAVPPGAYPNGHGVYNPAQGHYSASNFHPSNPFYCADQMPQRAAPGPYPSQGCPPEQSGAAGRLDFPRDHIPTIVTVATRCPPTLRTRRARLCTPDHRQRAGDTPPIMDPHRSSGRLHNNSSLGSSSPGCSSSFHKTTTAIQSAPNILQRGQGLERGPHLPTNQSPGLARVHQIMVRVLLLQEDVDEFVGKKTDKTYRYLEELLTKELLALDSVETRGQEAVRQARKEAVQRIQALLDGLEKKAF